MDIRRINVGISRSWGKDYQHDIFKQLSIILVFNKDKHHEGQASTVLI